MKYRSKHVTLKRELGLLEVTLYGTGIILGAGIYALIGIGAGVSGNMLWLSFVLSALIASFTGLSYAELSSMYPKEAAEYVYTKRAFRSTAFSFMVEWVMIVAAIVSVGTVALGFAGYFTHLLGGSMPLVAAGLIVALSFFNFWGIKESARFNNVSTVIEASGLVLVIAVGLYSVKSFASVDFFEMPASGFGGITAAIAVIFFAYIGFEDVANISEEARDPIKTIPRGLLLALAFSTILYILVAVASTGLLGWEKLAASKAPLTDVVGTVIPNASWLMSVIALFATSNTVLVMLIVASRMFYGISCNHALPKALCRIHPRRGTPYISVVLVMLLSLGSLLLGNIKTVALLTDLGIFITYLFINASLIMLRFTQPHHGRPFKSPLNVGCFPVLAGLGVISCAIMLLHFEFKYILFELLILGVGVAVYAAFRGAVAAETRG